MLHICHIVGMFGHESLCNLRPFCDTRVGQGRLVENRRLHVGILPKFVVILVELGLLVDSSLLDLGLEDAPLVIIVQFLGVVFVLGVHLGLELGIGVHSLVVDYPGC